MIPTYENTRITTWFERDRANVNLLQGENYLVSWWDDAVTEAITDGFLDPKNYHQSAWDYYNEHFYGKTDVTLHGAITDEDENTGDITTSREYTEKTGSVKLRRRCDSSKRTLPKSSQRTRRLRTKELTTNGTH